jgi:cytohesin
MGLSPRQLDTSTIIANARKRFNVDAKDGIRYLVEAKFFSEGGTAAEVARFLYTTPDLNKRNIGDYLGEHHSRNLETLALFVGMHDFSGMAFDKALRQYLWSFRLPGEAQKIDRMMELFAHRFCECNPGVFHHTDGCYILAFSCIMLNTSLHNPNVQFKPTVEQFISMNADVDDGKCIDETLLRDIYTRFVLVWGPFLAVLMLVPLVPMRTASQGPHLSSLTTRMASLRHLSIPSGLAG